MVLSEIGLTWLYARLVKKELPMFWKYLKAYNYISFMA